MTEDKRQVIKRKIEAINFELKNLTDETFGVSISAGIAFYDQKSDQKDIYKEADDALYAVKNTDIATDRLAKQTIIIRSFSRIFEQLVYCAAGYLMLVGLKSTILQLA